MQFRSHARAGRTLAAGLLAFAALTGGAAAAAESEMIVNQRNPDLVTREVHVGDLDLASADGQRTLALRIDRAALAVCEVTRGSKLDRTPRALQCLDDARAGAVAQLDAKGYGASLAVAAAGLF